MEKYLITGFSGFVSYHFMQLLESLEQPVSVLGLDLILPDQDILQFKYVKWQFRQVDLLDKDQVDNALFQFQPDFLLHLASFSSVAYSWKNPMASFSNNTNIFLNLLEQIKTLNLKCRILSIGSSEEYGKVFAEELPLTERNELRPLSPYAVARVSQEMLSKVYVDGYGLDIVLTRSFNHIGPGQRDIFVVSSFAKQISKIKKYGSPPEIITGDLTIVRDFLDVRDVVKAYHLLFKKGGKGEVYNICSGEGVTLGEVIQQMASLSEIEVKTITNPELIRPQDNQMIVGSNEKLVSETGWKRNVNLGKSITDILDYWESKV